ncbi:hypothetical protein LIER_43009 [Lithospermum erythrorhizon]|uniref:Uncharacterized protein n=1 Tax=Lithospermum erythrorhizon TaxID=34254 RepID=A0AAV3PA69_LITER
MFSKIGSFLGNPLFADGATSEISRVSYARLYVEIEAKKEIPDFVSLVNASGVEFRQKLECEWKLPVCKHCLVFCHDLAHCRYGGFPSVEEQENVNEVDSVVEQDSIVDKIDHMSTPVLVAPVKIVILFQLLRAFFESLGGGDPDPDSMKDFNECIRDIEVVEHPHSGIQFTWCRNWKEKGLLRVLDRVLCNKEWFDHFKNSVVDIPAPTESDQCSFNISVESDVKSEPRPFKYHHFWSKHDRFYNIVSGVWAKEVNGNGMDILHQRLKEVRGALRTLNLKISVSGLLKRRLN